MNDIATPDSLRKALEILKIEVLPITSAYTDNVTEYASNNPLLVVKPESRQDVLKIVAFANKTRTPVFPFSSGKNWGQGSKIPVAADAILLDFSAMNRILTLSEEHRYIIIEPGVTQKQLSDSLLGTKFMVPMTGSGNATSVLGNFLERGTSFYFHRNNFLLGLEAITGTEKIVRTGYWHFFEDETTTPMLHYSPGVGPDLTGLFTQSNMGIVTAAVLRLVPKPTGTCAYIEFKEEDLTEILNGLLALKDEHIIADYLLVTNKNDPRTTTDNKYVYKGEWVAFFTINGSRSMIEAAKQNIRDQIGSKVSMSFYWDAATPEHELPHPYFRIQQDLMLGIPSDYAIETMANMYGADVRTYDYNVDRSKHMPGFSVVLTAIPHHSATVLQALDIINQISKKMNMQVFNNLGSLTPTTFEGYHRVYFNRGDAASVAAAHAWNDEVTSALQAAGIFPYRLNNQQMKFICNRPEDEFWQTAADIKQALDPNLIINPGKYGLK